MSPGLTHFSVAAAAIAVAGILDAPASSAAEGGSTLIVNGLVLDGTGSPATAGSVRIEGQRIAATGVLAPRTGETIIDAKGLVLAPGFIDTHSHHDLGIFEQRHAVAATSQGITTIVVGQDGSSVHSLRDFFIRLEQQPVAINVASYVGHNTVRASVMGEDFRRAATRAEILRMRELVATGMRDGAIGLSTGLEYDPGIYSKRAEVLALAREAARYGGRYISHIRSEDRHLWKALDEIVNIGRVTNMPVHVSHMKLAMTDWWGEADRFIDVLERARAGGVDITGDVYPYEYWQSSLTVLFPERNFSDRSAAELALRSLATPDGLLLSRFSPDPTLAGKTIEQIAKLRQTDPATTLMSLIAESRRPGAEESVIATSMRQDDVERLIAWPHSNICTDGTLAGTHPRGSGSFTRVLRLYARERKTLSLQEAVRKMTDAAASHMGLEDRGTIVRGAFADLVLLDPATVGDRASLANPNALSVGVQAVWVNGTLVFENGRATGATPGAPIRREGRAR